MQQFTVLINEYTVTDFWKRRNSVLNTVFKSFGMIVYE
jgi:hypothetical protein